MATELQSEIVNVDHSGETYRKTSAFLNATDISEEKRV